MSLNAKTLNLKNVKIDITPLIKINYDGKQLVIDERELLKKGINKENLKYIRAMTKVICDSNEEILKGIKEGESFGVMCPDISPKKYKKLTRDLNILFEYDKDYRSTAFKIVNTFSYFTKEKKLEVMFVNGFLEQYLKNGKYIDIEGKEVKN